MNYWWRLYAHLAPLLPDSPVLLRVLANARAGATEPRWKDRHLMVSSYDATRLLRRMRTMDDDELKDASDDLRWIIRSLGGDEQKRFTTLYGSAFKDDKPTRAEYIRMFRFYRGRKMKRGPHK